MLLMREFWSLCIEILKKEWRLGGEPHVSQCISTHLNDGNLKRICTRKGITNKEDLY